MTPKLLRETVDRLFSKRGSFMTLCQEIAENFYPERADFTLRRTLSDEYAGNLMSSYPVLSRRDLGDQIGTMLRPTAKPWFHMGLQDDEKVDTEGKRWLEWAEGVQRRAMYDRASLFAKATKQADHDFAAFGQAPMSVRLNRNRDALLFRTWHLRDVVWMEDEEGKICLVARKWKPTVYDALRLFPGKCHPTVSQLREKDPFTEIDCYHIVCNADMLEENSGRFPYRSLYMDTTHDHTMESVPSRSLEYVIPRWQTVSGSQYALSPATITALPDARLIQQMAWTLLEAGEKAVNPPLVATMDAVRSDVNLMAGGITWVDQDYDERLGEALRPLTQDFRGMPSGIEMARDARLLIAQAFYLNKLTLPARAPEMTAYEIGQRVQEYIRGALPIFEPMETEYNGGLCDAAFDVLLHNGAFGSVFAMPKSLRNRDIQFRFASPLHDIIEEQKGQKFVQAKALVAEAVALDPSVAAIIDAKKALRDALSGIQVPAAWTRSDVEVQQIQSEQQAQQQQQQLLQSLEQASGVTANLAGAQKDMASAERAAA